MLKSLVISALFSIAQIAGSESVITAESPVVSDSLLVHFRCDKTVYDSNYLGNSETLQMFKESVDSLGPERLESIDITGYASPEGVTEHNHLLSRKRSVAVKAQIMKIAPEWSKPKITVKPGFESWDLLRKRIVADTLISDALRDKIIGIMDNPDIGNDTKKWRLVNRLGTEAGIGDVWTYILKNHLRYLRCVVVIIRHDGGKEIELQFVPEEQNVQEGQPASEQQPAQEGQLAQGQQAIQGDQTIYFRRNQSGIDPGYLGNRESKAELLEMLGEHPVVDSIAIYSWSSPEGKSEVNARLSQSRANSAKKLILDNTDLPPDRIKIHNGEENWPGLNQAVLDSYSGENKEQILRILSDDTLNNDQKEKELRLLDSGETMQELIETLMGPLRCATFVVYRKNAELFGATATGSVELKESGGIIPKAPAKPVQQAESPPEEKQYDKRTVLAVKTNGLYDLLSITNYAVEVPIGKQFSAQFEHYCPWWSTKKDLKYCMQYLSLGGEFRWWFAPKPKPETPDRMLRDALTGHFVGIYGLYCKTDIQWQDKIGMYQCNPIFSVGLSYGYSFPLTKHWNMELSATAGYARIPYQHYIPSEDWQILWRDRDNQGILHYFGPTQLKVSLVRPIVVKYRVRR